MLSLCEYNVSSTDSEEEEDDEKKSFPMWTAYILAFEFCECFSFYGIKSILTFYLMYILQYDREDSKLILYGFVFLVYVLCFIGAIVSDNWLGKFKSIMYLAPVYAFGLYMLALSGVSPPYILQRIAALSGLFLIAMTSGGIKSLIPSIAGDQFTLPEQSRGLSEFYQMFYFTINVGSLISSLVVPALQMKISCNGVERCDSIAFLVPAIVMSIGIIIIYSGRRRYIHAPKYGHMIAVYFNAVTHAIATKWKSKEKRDHWLDYAEDEYDVYIIDDLKALLRLLILYCPLPIFWAVYNHQGTSWLFQAARMNSDMGKWNINPEQWIYVNSLMILLLIPIFNIAIYPILSAIGIRRPLQKMVIGGILTGVAFLMSAILEFQLEKTYPILPEEKNAQLRIFNGVLCDYNVTTNIKGQEKFILKALDAYIYRDIDVPNGTFLFRYKFSSADAACPRFRARKFFIPENTAYTMFLKSNNKRGRVVYFEDNVDKPSYGLPYGRILANIDVESTVAWTPVNNTDNIIYEEPAIAHKLMEFQLGTYSILVEETIVVTLTLRIGGSYTIVINEKEDGVYVTKIYFITEPNSIHITWQLPQYIALSTAEVLYAITGLEFSYSQAPVTMKSFILACWVATIGIGNGIGSIFAGTNLMKTSYELLVFSILMFVDMMLFAYLAYVFQPFVPFREYRENGGAIQKK